MRVLARRVHWTEREYLTLEEGSATRHEYLDGEIYAMAGGTSRHNAICANVIGALWTLVRRGPCRAFTSDQRIRVDIPQRFYTYADGGVACGQWQIAGQDGMSLENPVLLFEVLSPSTREYDRGTKLSYFRQIPSLTDVLIIDQPRPLVEHHHRSARGWRTVTRRRGTIAVLGGVLLLADLYDVPPGLSDPE